jgi:hypothetical protein
MDWRHEPAAEALLGPHDARRKRAKLWFDPFDQHYRRRKATNESINPPATSKAQVEGSGTSWAMMSSRMPDVKPLYTSELSTGYSG